jgi:hypothetical protein
VTKKVLVHTCFAIAEGEQLPSICACYQRVDLVQAKRIVGENLAEWVTDGKKTAHDAICIIGGVSRRTPRTATIDEKHIERAYLNGDLEERIRINVYGELSREVIADLVTLIPAEEFDRKKKSLLDVPVLQFIEDNRTPGGVSEENR